MSRDEQRHDSRHRAIRRQRKTSDVASTDLAPPLPYAPPDDTPKEEDPFSFPIWMDVLATEKGFRDHELQPRSHDLEAQGEPGRRCSSIAEELRGLASHTRGLCP